MRWSKTMRAAVLVCLATMGGVAAAQGYPQRPVRLIVPYPPGGAADVVARHLAQRLAPRLGQPVVVENKTGAGGAIGAEAAARSLPDGYTLLLGSASELSIVPAVRSLSYQPTSDFTPVILVAKFPMVLVVNKSVPAADLKAFVAHAKSASQKGRLSYASIGAGTTTHVAVEHFRLTTGIPPMTNVPYKGGAPALQDVIAGHVPFMFDTLVSSMGQIKSGNVRALGITSTGRWETLPEVPTIAESGYPGFEFGGWSGVLGPAGLPADIVARLNRGITEVLKDPQMRDALLNAGAATAGGSASEFAAFIRAESEKNARVVKEAKISAD